MPRKKVGKTSGSSKTPSAPDVVDPAILRRRWPTAYDKMLRYNAPRNGISLYRNLYDVRVKKDPYTYFSTIPRPLAIWNDGCVSEDAEKFAGQFLESSSVPRHDIYGELALDRIRFKYSGELMGVGLQIDRTLETPVMIPDAITVEFIRHLQNTLLVAEPLWRVQIVGTQRDGEESVMVYPQVVCVGKVQCPPNDLETSLAKWRQETNATREKELGPARRQFQYVKSRLPELISQIRKYPPVVFAAAFDNYEGDRNRVHVWTLQVRRRTFIPESPKGGGHAVQFKHVTSTGKVVFDVFDRRVRYGIHSWVFPRRKARPPFTVVMQDYDTKEVVGKLKVRPKDVVTDEELRARFNEPLA